MRKYLIIENDCSKVQYPEKLFLKNKSEIKAYLQVKISH